MSDDRMTIEGELAKRFRVYTTDINDKPFERVGEYDTIAEVRARKSRLDKHYKIQTGDRTFMTRHEFDAWAKTQTKPRDRRPEIELPELIVPRHHPRLRGHAWRCV